MKKLCTTSCIAVIFAIILIACKPGTPTFTQTNSISATKTLTATKSPPSTNTIQPTSTKSPSKTPSPTPTQTPAPPITPLALPESLVIAFTRDDTLWIWKNGVETQIAEAPIESLDLLVNTNQVALSSDKQIISFTKGDKEIWGINVDGTGERLLVGEDFYASLGVDRPYKIKWLPYSHVLLFNTYSYPQTGIYQPTYDLHMVNADTGSLKTIAVPGKGGNAYSSPDGKSIAVISSTSISIFDSDGNLQRTVLTYPYAPVSGEDDFIFSSKPVWTKDSQAFVIAIPDVDFRAFPTTADTKIWRIDKQSFTAELILQKDLSPFNPGPLISPNSNYILYEPVGEVDTEINKLYLLDSATSEEILVYEGKLVPFVMSWLPDSEHYILTLDQEIFLGDIRGIISSTGQASSLMYKMRWLDSKHYFWINEEDELRLGIIGEPGSILLTTLGHFAYDVYDFVP